MRVVRPAVLFALFAPLVAGCGGPTAAPTTVEFKGTVTLPGGTPLAAGTIYLEAVVGSGGRDEFTAVKDGAFAFPTGVLPGKYKVAFDVRSTPGKTSPVPKQYQSFEKSDLNIDLTKSDTAYKFELK